MKSGQEHMPDDAKERESRLRRLLALKRYETPSPGYFEQFPARVMARLEEERPSEAASPLTAWLFGAWRPALAGACLAALALAVGRWTQEEEGIPIAPPGAPPVSAWQAEAESPALSNGAAGLREAERLPMSSSSPGVLLAGASNPPPGSVAPAGEFFPWPRRLPGENWAIPEWNREWSIFLRELPFQEEPTGRLQRVAFPAGRQSPPRR
ncbi:MAG: hypothetical protein J7M29_12995 [Verrucomicrobia bacterium]|nr:hypothetical protein [Verrucomicrobiota bacterium]